MYIIYSILATNLHGGITFPTLQLSNETDQVICLEYQSANAQNQQVVESTLSQFDSKVHPWSSTVVNACGCFSKLLVLGVFFPKNFF
jgi:hypothetical protein